MSTPDNVKRAWQTYASDAVIPTIEEVRRSAARFDRKIRTRNVREYVAGLFVVLIFSLYTLTLSGLWIKIGSVVTVIAICFVMWQLHRRASALRGLKDIPVSGVLEHQRRSLVRQRDALKSVFWWYILPLLPGMIIFFIAMPKPSAAEWNIVFVTLILLMNLGIWHLNQRAAAKMQRTIDEIDGLMGEAE